MDALLMCGGRGTRLDAAVEKPLYEIGGRPMIDRVHEALDDSRVETTHAVVSPDAPRTREHVDGPVVDAPGDGYVADLGYALERVEPPVLTVAADLPLLAGDAVDAVLDRHAAGSIAVYVPLALKRSLGVSVDATATAGGRAVAPTGVNVVSPGGDEEAHVTDDARLAVNVNHPGDARAAEELIRDAHRSGVADDAHLMEENRWKIDDARRRTDGRSTTLGGEPMEDRRRSEENRWKIDDDPGGSN